MNLKKWISPKWELYLIIAIFICFKVPHLFLAYYWDESWPYLPAITEMYKNGISLMPNAISAELSRGHPLFFHVIGAIWMTIFGNSHLAMHSFAMSISLSLLVFTYGFCFKYFNRRSAIIATILLVTHEMFFVQSSFVLFEVLVALLSLLSIYFYVGGRYIACALSLSALFFTKESGLVAGAVLGLDVLYSLFNQKAAWKERFAKMATVGVPFVLIGLFFLVQKHIRGWYVFPLYTDTLQLTWDSFWYRFQMCTIRESFHFGGGEYKIFLGLIVLTMVAAVKQRDLRYLIFLFPAWYIYHFIDELRNDAFTASYVSLPLFLFSYVAAIYVLSSKLFSENKEQQKAMWLGGVFIISFLVFSALAYFSSRYLLPAVVFIFIITAVALDRLFQRTNNLLVVPALLLIVFFNIKSIYSTNEVGDCRVGAFQAIKVQQDRVNWLERSGLYEQRIYSQSYLCREHLIDPSTGFLSGKRHFTSVTNNLDSTSKLLIFDSIEPDPNYEQLKADTTIALIKRINNAWAWTEIYQRK